MLGVLQGNFRRQTSDRRLRLFICGCVRQLPEHLWPDGLPTLIDYAESFADGSVSLADVSAFRGRSEPRHSDDRVPILADALQDAGCGNDDILSHCRGADATHVRGCWVMDIVLGKA